MSIKSLQMFCCIACVVAIICYLLESAIIVEYCNKIVNYTWLGNKLLRLFLFLIGSGMHNNNYSLMFNDIVFKSVGGIVFKNIALLLFLFTKYVINNFQFKLFMLMYHLKKCIINVTAMSIYN